MKKKYLMSILLFALLLVGCGSNLSSTAVSDDVEEAEETVSTEAMEEESASESEKVDVSGEYGNISLFFASTYKLNDNGTYDRTSPDAKGTYVVDNESGDIEFTRKDSNSSDIYAPYGEYYYCSNDEFYDTDVDYGIAPSFDENGKSTQTFQSSFAEQPNGEYMAHKFSMNEDGTFSILEERALYTNNILYITDEKTFDGEYSVDGEIITLKWNDEEYQLLYLDNKIFYDVIERQTENTLQKLEKRLGSDSSDTTNATEVWYKDFYVDEFEQPMDEWFIGSNSYFSGTFNNSATTDSQLKVNMLYNMNNEFEIFLYEYGNRAVKNNSSTYYDEYSITMRTADGQDYNLSGIMYTGADRITIDNTSDVETILDALKGEGDVSFYIVNDQFTTSTYLFTIPTANFKEVLEQSNS